MYRPEFELVALNKPHCTVHKYIENSNQPHQRRNFARVSFAWLIRALSGIFTSSTTLVVHVIVLFPFCHVLRDFTANVEFWQASLCGQCHDISAFPPH